MSLHTDIPTRAEIEGLLNARNPASISIYLPTTPVTPDTQADRIAFKNLVSQAVAALPDDLPRGHAAAIDEELTDLQEDDAFWALQANSLAVFATADRVRTFRLPNQLSAAVQVGDRFLVKPLLRTVTFPQAAFVLALAQGSVRLLEVDPGMPAAEVRVPDLPSDAASAVGKASITDRSASGAIQGSEGQKVLMRQYARAVDRAVRGVLAGLDQPLILAAAQPLDAIYREVNGYPHLAAQSIEGNPETTSDGDLALAAREVLDALYAAELAELTDLLATRDAAGRAARDLTDVARAATFGAVDTVFVDIDAVLPGTIDEETGVVTAGEGDDDAYGLIDEITRRVLLSGGRVLAVRAQDVPGGGPTAAILRYPV